jgi:hypothetical protein
LRPRRSAVVGQIFLQQANWRRAVWGFFNSIDPNRKSSAISRGHGRS